MLNETNDYGYPLLVKPFTENGKLTGGASAIGATYRPVGPTCPSTCAALSICYAKRGPTSIQQKNSANRHDSLVKARYMQYLRHLVSGDFLRPDGSLDVDLVLDMIVFHIMHPKVIGWGYTHAISKFIEAGFMPSDFPPNLNILASCDTESDIALAKANGWRVARISKDGSDKKSGEALCPYDTHGMHCDECRLCIPGRKTDIVFIESKGGGKKAAKR